MGCFSCKKAKNILTGARKVTKYALQKALGTVEEVPIEIYKERLLICSDCSILIKPQFRCGECDCPVRVKNLFSEEECPIGKWHAYKRETKSNNESS